MTDQECIITYTHPHHLQMGELVAFLTSQLPGDKSPLRVQLLKGAMRETEADRMWALRDVPPSDVSHLRSAFYTDDLVR
jgi:hypothetical protein